MTENFQVLRDFFLAVGAVIGIAVSWFAVRKSQLEIRKAEIEIERLSATQRADAGPSEVSPRSAHQSNREERELKTKYLGAKEVVSQSHLAALVYKALSPVLISVFVLSLLSPEFSHFLPNNVVAGGWPTGFVWALNRFPSVYIPYLVAVTAALAFRELAIRRGGWFNGNAPLFWLPSTKKYVFVFFFAYVVAYFTIVVLHPVQSYFILGLIGEYRGPNRLLLPVLPALASVYFLWFTDFVTDQASVPRLYLSIIYVVATSILSFFIFSEFYGAGYEGAILFSTLLATAIALTLWVMLSLLTPSLQEPRRIPE